MGHTLHISNYSLHDPLFFTLVINLKIIFWMTTPSLLSIALHQKMTPQDMLQHKHAEYTSIKASPVMSSMTAVMAKHAQLRVDIKYSMGFSTLHYQPTGQGIKL
jgi:hypothetical protein